MAEIRNVKVKASDIESVSEKLQAFAKQLPPGEQNVMAWLLGRAAEAPPDKGTLHERLAAPATEAAAPRAPAVGREAGLSPERVNLSHALGISQFARARPGTLAAGSSIGVTATVMF